MNTNIPYNSSPSQQKKFEDNFVKQLTSKHGNLFNLSEMEYVNNRTPIKITCNKCLDSFTTIPFNILKYKKCPNCSDIDQRKNTSVFIEESKKVHGDIYDYSKCEYFNAKTKVIIICKKCKTEFSQKPCSHTSNKSGCPNCKNSRGEIKIKSLLDFIGIEYEQQKTFDNCIGIGGRKLKFDFYIPSKNLCLEYDGKQHTDTTSKYWSETLEKNDETKNNYCKDNNINLKRISFTGFKNIEKTINRILNTL